MTEMPIPEDILEKARAICDEYEPSEHAVAVAIARERERCARIATNHGAVISNDIVGKACSNNIAHEIRDPNCILAAIRNQP